MDVKVKQMIEIIEEDADSFAQRAEMYYKKRPELMNLVEEFYRSYRALAERYDHATGLILHAHHNLAELNEPVSHTKLFDETQEINVENGRYDDDDDDEEEEEVLLSEWERLNKVEAEILGLKKGVEILESEKEGGLVFEYEDERLCNIESQVFDVRENCERVEKGASKAEGEVEKMKEVITKLDAQKEAASVMYRHCFHKMNNLENNISSVEVDHSL
ncbi:hypothetical protein TanjilG_02336 [Lupinus angustifolius]|uniref:NAB domain-containing protein n=1 Tax=Lupinus angustifolius TaxID=3871 RepID=A0A4P1QQP9_LUPAN|nr:hypothetical protein TanjilG_02336 [Lupinus angustifolius]